MKVLIKGNKSQCESRPEKENTNWAFNFSPIGFDQGDCCCYDDKC